MKVYEGYIDVDGQMCLRVIGPDGLTQMLPKMPGTPGAGWGRRGNVGGTAFHIVMDAYEDMGDEADGIADGYYDDLMDKILNTLDPDEGFKLDWNDVRSFIDKLREE